MPLFKVRVMATATLDKVFEIEAESMDEALDEAFDVADNVEEWNLVLNGGDIEVLDTEPAED